MQWAQNNLLPTLKKKYPGKNMILIANNSPYPYKRAIVSLASLSKNKLIKLMKCHHIDYIDLPITTDARNDLLDLEDHPDHPDIQNKFHGVRI